MPTRARTPAPATRPDQQPLPNRAPSAHIPAVPIANVPDLSVPPLLVGLTGSIASGKSTVSEALAARGATIVDADALAREAVAPGTSALERIAARWGAGVLRADGTLDRAALRQIVFTDPAARGELERIVHPDVEVLRERAVAAARAAGATIIVCDIPLLFERQLESRFDVVVFVEASDEVRLVRLTARRGLSDADARAMMAAQLPNAVKRKRADITITNDGSLDALHGQVATLWARLDDLARSHR